jgi:hypothetical protein
MLLALPVSRALSSSGEIVGRCEITSAAAPDTIAVDCDVPLPRKKRDPSKPVLAYRWSMNEPGTRSDAMCTPGAARSGVRSSLPLLVNDAAV